MPDLVIPTRGVNPGLRSSSRDRVLLVSSIILQILLGLFFGHAYDMPILMSTGYLVGTGQNPYLPQDLSAVFHHGAFQGITSFGYPPPWALVLGSIYFFSYRVIPNFLLYNLALKLPVIACNVCLAYLAAHILNKLDAPEKTVRSVWIFLLFNPFLLLTSSAWGQFDPVIALLALLALFLVSAGHLSWPAVLLALAVSLKPTAIPLVPVIIVYLLGEGWRRGLYFTAVFTACLALFCVAPFVLFGWDPTPILRGWNYHFTQGGGLSFMTYLEYTRWSYLLSGSYWPLGWVWLPALGFAVFALRPGIKGLRELFKKGLALVLVFYLCRAWVAETNINLILPLVLILTSLNELKRASLALVWGLALIFSFINTSIAQLFFPSMPGLMDTFLKIAVAFSTVRYAIRTLLVVAWLAAGWWIVYQCFQKARTAPDGISA